MGTKQHGRRGAVDSEVEASGGKLGELGEECSARVDKWLANGGAGNVRSIGKLHSTVRAMLRDELAEIDELVKGIPG